MVEMGAHDDVLVLQDGVAAFEDPDDIFAVAGFAMDREMDIQFLSFIERKGIELGVGAGAVEDLRARELLTLEQGVGEFQTGRNGWRAGTCARGLELYYLEWGTV